LNRLTTFIGRIGMGKQTMVSL